MSDLSKKLNPSRFTDMSPKMAALVAYFLDEEWTTPKIHSLSITSDGYVVSIDCFIGSASDMEDNISRLLDVADLTDEERAEWNTRYAHKMAGNDWRPGRGRI